MTNQTTEALAERITAYLSEGGMFNPELAEHAAVRDLLIDCRAALSSQPPAPRELTSAQIERGWHDTFSTSNPFCPCDLKSFTKAVRWAERRTAPASLTATAGSTP